MTSIYVQLLLSIGIAIVYGLANFFHNTPPEQFSYGVFLKTVLIGVAVGYIQIEMGLTYDQALTFVTTNAVLMAALDKIVNAILTYFHVAIPKPKGNGGIPI